MYSLPSLQNIQIAHTDIQFWGNVSFRNILFIIEGIMCENA